MKQNNLSKAMSELGQKSWEKRKKIHDSDYFKKIGKRGLASRWKATRKK